MIRTPSDFSLTPKPHAKTGNLYKHGKKNVIYCRFFCTVNGKKKEVRRSTGRRDQKEARAIAWKIYQDETGVCSEGAPRKLRSTSPKLGTIADFISDNRVQCFKKASASSVTGYVNALGRAVSLVTGANDWRDHNLSTLTDRFVHVWREKKYLQRGLDRNNEDVYFNALLNSEWNNVKACFGKQATLAMRDAGMVLPDSLDRFLSVPRMAQEVEGFTEIDKEIDAKMQLCAQAAIHRARGLDYLVPDGYDVPSATTGVIYEMARFAGLTQKEIAHAWRGWLAPKLNYIDVQPFQDSKGVNFTTKANAKNGRVPTNPTRVRWWLEALGTTGEYLLPATTFTARVNLCGRAANAWIAPFLPDRHKRLHELRKQAGSDVFKINSSLTAAAAFIRDSENTARAYYMPKGHNAGQFGVVGL